MTMFFTQKKAGLTPEQYIATLEKQAVKQANQGNKIDKVA